MDEQIVIGWSTVDKSLYGSAVQGTTPRGYVRIKKDFEGYQAISFRFDTSTQHVYSIFTDNQEIAMRFAESELGDLLREESVRKPIRSAAA
jgi:hypothetical protein